MKRWAFSEEVHGNKLFWVVEKVSDYYWWMISDITRLPAVCLFIVIDYTLIIHVYGIWMTSTDCDWQETDWQTQLTHNMNDYLIDCLIDWLIDRRMDRQTVRLTDNTEWLNDFRTDWLTGSAGWYTNVLNIVSINVAVLKLFSIRHISWVNK